MKRRLITFLWFLMLLPSCSKQQKIIKKKVTITPRCHRHENVAQFNNENPPITIWVHGTRLIRRPIYYNFFNGKPGFQKATVLDSQYHLREVADILSFSDPKKFPLDHFYLFGWSGKLNAIEREDAASVFYTDLQSIIAEYNEQYNAYPTIHIICHSHGGNVILNLAKIENTNEIPITIAELILLACPVQKSTMDLIRNPMFEKVYSFYSSLDLVQIIAPQIIHKTSRSRKGKTRIAIRFPLLSNQRFPLHKNVTQVKIKINNRAIWHSEFTTAPFLSSLPQVVSIVNDWDTHDQNNEHYEPIHLLCLHTKRPTHEVS